MVERMRSNRFPVDDPLFAAVQKAWEAASHACTCRNKVHWNKVHWAPAVRWVGHADRPYLSAFAVEGVITPRRAPAPPRGC